MALPIWCSVPDVRAQGSYPEGNDDSDANDAEEGARALVVAGDDAPPVLELAEHVPDRIALLVEFGIVSDRFLAARPTGGQGTIPCPTGVLQKRSLS